MHRQRLCVAGAPAPARKTGHGAFGGRSKAQVARPCPAIPARHTVAEGATIPPACPAQEPFGTGSGRNAGRSRHLQRAAPPPEPRALG
ncbi:hypothetical protein [Azospirillum palustre]